MIFPIAQMKKEKIKIIGISKVMELLNDEFIVCISYIYDNECYSNSLKMNKKTFNRLDANLISMYPINTYDDINSSETIAEVYIITDTSENGIVKTPFLKSISIYEESETDG